MKTFALVVAATMGLAQPARRDVKVAVVDVVSGAPVGGASVSFLCSIPHTANEQRDAQAAGLGLFVVTDIPRLAGCSATASREGYLRLQGVPVVEDALVLKLSPESAITATVSSGGQPLSSQVYVIRRTFRFGKFAPEMSGTYVTDDQGRLHIAQLSAGDYKICVVPPRSERLEEHKLFYPMQCQQVSLGVGETRELGFEEAPEAGVRVSGGVLNAKGRPVIELRRELHGGGPEHVTWAAWNAEDSTFEFPAVLPGDYLIVADELPGTSEGWRAIQQVKVGASDLGGLQMTMSPNSELRGKLVTLDGATLPPDVAINFVENPGPPARVAADGTFNVTLATSQSFTLELRAQPPWHIESLFRSGKEIAGGRLNVLPDRTWGQVEIQVSEAHGTVLGSVRAEGDQVFVISALEGSGAAVKPASGTVTRDRDFRFSMDLPPGDYRVLAWSPGVNVPYLEDDFLVSAARYVQLVHVAAGEMITIHLDPIPKELGAQ